MTEEIFLTVKNAHTKDSGQPTTFESGDGYLSYFENEYGEQWVFSMDWESGVFFLCGGDIGWKDRKIGEQGLTDLVLDSSERMWVLACLSACKLSDVAGRVVEAWQEFDGRIGR